MSQNKTITLTPSEELQNSLEWYCRMTQKTPEQAIEEAIRATVTPFDTDYKKPKKGQYFYRKPFSNKETPIDCWILGKNENAAEKRYRIVVNGSIMEVPVREVRIAERGEL